MKLKKTSSTTIVMIAVWYRLMNCVSFGKSKVKLRAKLKKNSMKSSKTCLVASILTVMVKSATKSTFAQYHKMKKKS